MEEGLEAALNERQKSRYRRKSIDVEKEARLVALAGSEPADGCARWTMKRLADCMVELEYVDSLSVDKNRFTPKLVKNHRTLLMTKVT